MAGSRIKGITIEIDGNTTKLQSSLSSVNKDLKTTQTNLKDVNKLLKLDPTNVDLLKQKQAYLKQAIDDTKKKLDQEKEALRQLKEADQTPEVIAQQEALERQIAEDEAALKSLKDEMGPFSSAGMQAFFAVGEKVKAVGENIKSVGETLTKNVTVPLAALGGASIAAFKNVDDGYDEMIKKTGATGDEADALRKIMENLTTSIPTDFDTAGKAVGEVSTRFGIAGDELEDLSGQFIKFADLNNTDVSNSIDKVQKALAAYGLDARDAGSLLDRLNYTGQQTGISVDKLADGVVNSAGVFQELGLSVDQAATFIGKVEKSGADTNTVMGGMSKALKTATKNGKPLNKALKELQDNILNGTDGMDGLTMAYDLFGKSGDKIYAAVKNGTLDFTTMDDVVQAAGENISKTFAETQDPLDDFKMTMNQLKLAGAGLGTSLLTVLKPCIEKVTEVIKKVKEWWDKLDPKTQETIVKIGLVVAAIGPVLTVLGTLVMAIGALMSPIGLVVVAIAAAVAAGILLYKNWDKIKAYAKKLYDTIKEKFTFIKDTIISNLEKARDKVKEIWEKIKEKITTVVKTVKEKVSNGFETMKNAVQTTLNTLRTVISTIWNTIKTTVINTVTTIKTTVINIWNTIKNTVSTVLNNIRMVIQTEWNLISTVVTTVVNLIKNTISNVFNAIYTTVSTVWNNIKVTISGAWENIKSKVSDSTSNVKTTMSTAWNSIKTTASDVWAGIKTAITNPISTAKTMIEGYVTTIKSFLNFSGLYDTVLGVFGDIKSAITSPIDSAKTIVQDAIDFIKGLFPFDLGNICSLKLPHISVSAGTAPWGIGGKGTKPSFSVSWYRKAYDNPYLFTTPTIVGNKGFGDGPGSGELVYGRDQLLRDIALASGGDEITINVYASENMSVNQLANEIQLRLAQQQRQKASAYA